MLQNKVPNVRFCKYLDIWKTTKLNKITEIIGGGTPDTKQFSYWNGGINWFSPTEVGKTVYLTKSEKTISQLGLQKSSAKLLPAFKTILFTSRAGIGDVGIITEESATNQGFQSLVVNEETDVYFLYSYSDQIKKYALKHSAGSTFLEISGKELGKMDLSIPSLPEQSAIGSLFCTLDDLLASYKDNLTNYQSLKATMLSKMFPKAGQTVPEIRLYGFEGEWEEKEFIKIVNRVTESSDSDSLPKVEFEDIISGQGKLNKDISSKFDNRKGILFKPGYTLYGKLRPYLNNWLLPKFEGVALGDFWVFDPNGNNSDFIYYLVQSSRYQKVANDTSGTKMPRSDWKSVSTTVFAIPQTIAEQQAIGAYFSNLDNLINSHQEKISQLEILKKKLLQDMFI